jgi:hypothetical protein
MNRFIAIGSAFFLTACTSIEERSAHMQGQIEIVRVQKDAEAMQKAAEANAKAKLYEALAAVAVANPDQASAVTVALAVQGVGTQAESGNTPIVPLQPIRNEGLEYAKVFAAPAMNVLSGVGIAAINANVARTQSDNAARVQINDAIQDSNIVEAVASLGQTAANAGGLVVSGDYLQVTDEGTLTQDFSTTTTSNQITDSYNPVTSTTTSNDYSTVTYEGQEFSLPNLLAYLQGTGLAYNLTIGDTVYTVDGDGDPQTIDCGVPDFSPTPPVCNGG